MGEGCLGFAEVLLGDEFGGALAGGCFQMGQGLLGSGDAEEVDAEEEVGEVVGGLLAEGALEEWDGFSEAGLLVEGEAVVNELFERGRGWGGWVGIGLRAGCCGDAKEAGCEQRAGGGGRRESHSPTIARLAEAGNRGIWTVAIYG